jgi:hypothetical protein
MSQPTPEFQIRFLGNLQRLLWEGLLVATYMPKGGSFGVMRMISRFPTAGDRSSWRAAGSKG